MSLPSRSPTSLAALGATLACALALGGCTPEGSAFNSGFISDNPFGSGPSFGGDTATDGAGGAGDGGEGDPSRAIAEADIIQIDGPRLYALSHYGGLSIIDISNPDKLALLGRYRATGTPFEMYLRGDTVYAMFSSWGRYECNAAGDVCSYNSSSHVEALDVHDPAHVVKLGSFDLPGNLSDSRIVGDVLYVVTYEDGYCWDCQAEPNTTITSLDVLDPASIGVVDQLRHTSPDPDGYGWWKRSITVNQDRMYIGGVDWDGNGEGHSTIQVVDISDPAGHLVPGATVQAKGQIESRWQMDEKDGVLRVISQPGVWWTSDVPTVQTFQVTSASEITPIAELDLVLPMPERLRSVRFDGDRAYAITAVQEDPLFTIDLSDPANPVQAGELEMPGWVYHMEPRGDRLYALGYEQNNPEGSLAVSLFDVADFANPTMLSRVHFGGDWSNLPEDQDRIHKSFKLDDDSGAIFVPYSAWDYGNGGDYYGCGAYESGIQIIDFTQDSLTKRGVAKGRGEARRAFVHGGRLFGVSDAAVTTFDIANRDAPEQKADLALSTNVSRTVVAGDKVVRLADDWWTGAARLEIVPASDPARTTPLGALDLRALDEDDANWCWGWGYWGARVFARGNFVYLVRTGGYDYGYDYGSGSPGDGPHAEITVVDIQNPAAPAVRGKLDFPLPQSYRWYGGLVSSGDDVALAGHAVVFLSRSALGYEADAIETATLEIVDVADPDHPARHSLALPAGYGHTGMLASGSKVRLSHWAPLPGLPDKVRFYIDAVDVSAPASPTITSINVPGSLLAWDTPSGRALTVDYERLTMPGMTYKACYALFGGNANFSFDDADTYDWENGTGTCTALHRTLELLDIDGGFASVADEQAIDDRSSLSQAMLGDDRVFLSTEDYGYYYDVGYGAGGGVRLLVVGGMRDGELAVKAVSHESADYAHPAAVAGKRIVMTSYNPPGLSVLDATNLDAITTTHEADLEGYSYDVTMMGDVALCSMGPYGLQTVDISK